MFRDEDVETLMRLGLTLLQARTYLVLSTLGSSTMATISKASSVARQDVYRVMPALQKLGIVEKVVKTPATYKALPIKDGLSLLLQQKKDNFAEVKKRALAMVENLQKIKEKQPEEDAAQFAIIYDQMLLYQKYEKYNTLAGTSIDCSGPWQAMKWLMSLCDCRNDLFTQAMKKGVRIRILTEERGEDSAVDNNIVGMSKNALFEIRFVSQPMSLKLVLYDGKEAYTSISTSPDKDMPMLWSNNPNFVGIIANQFEELWSKGAKFASIKPSRVAKKEKVTQKTKR
jgi:sugar-specific transcriptional regulator TrmB